jgi:hypothetical protein
MVGRVLMTQHDLTRCQEPLPQPCTPISVGPDRIEAADRDVDLTDYVVDETVEQGLLAGQVVVQRHGLDAELGGEAAHRQRLDPLRVRQGDRRRQHPLATERLPSRRCLHPVSQLWFALYIVWLPGYLIL